MVTVIIVNWNGGDLLLRCLKALQEQTVMPDQIILMDNNSSDNSISCLPRIDNLKIVELETNLGFARANNIAIQKVNSEYVALLNPDAFPERTWLQALLVAANKNPNFGSFASRQMSVHEPEIVDGVGDCYHFSGAFWRRGHRMPLQPKALKAKEVFSPCGGAALYRTDLFRQVGGFDTSFFCYGEDVDLGFRMQLHGFPCLYVPEAVVHHIGSALTSRISGFQTYYGHRNMVWVFFKNMPLPLLIVFFPAHLLVNILAFWVCLKRGHAKFFIKAKFDAWSELLRIFKERRLISSNRSISVLSLIKVLDFGKKNKF